MAVKLHPSIAVHPGRWLMEEIVAPAGLNVSEAAEHLGVARQSASAVLNGRVGVSADMALRVEKAFRHRFPVRADTLVRMQAAYDLAQARAHEADLVVRELEPA